ncbi:MAG TPA: cytochrome c biogenesis protein CcsA [Terracidiphilus sp.]|jgi:ABC-type uncharacterized transport system permease subunit|nr:cytochrome c biogenesis protein CcsA [Terracidiphilus sp.]
MHLLWLRVATILYAAASVTIFPAVLNSSERARRWCVHLGGMAFFFHFVSAVEMLVQAHRWVPVGAREVESLLGLAVVGLYFLAWWLYDAISLGVFALPITFFLVFVPSLGVQGYAFPSQGVRTSWLVAHIAALLCAYAALGFSLLSSILYLALERRLKSKLKNLTETGRSAFDWLPPLDTLERLANSMLLFGFPCMTVGLILGAVLVQETSLGAAYFADPKVLASFVMWGLYVLLIFLRWTAGLRGRKAAYFSGAVLIFMICVWAANIVSRVHRFGAP